MSAQGDEMRKKFTDLEKWQEYFSEYFDKFEDDLEEIMLSVNHMGSNGLFSEPPKLRCLIVGLVHKIGTEVAEAKTKAKGIFENGEPWTDQNEKDWQEWAGHHATKNPS